jgi:glycosyltransferase involved in cell wall biosynthesis
VASPRLGTLPTVAISFHWDAAVCPETRSAWRYYDPHLPRLCADPRFRVVGHGHPRLWPTIRRRWAELGVEQWPDVDRVLSEADLLVVDNSSIAFEMAAIGTPVVLLNLPSYRRDVEHGGRFWSAPPGVQVDHPSELADAIACALTDPPAHRAIRARAVEWAYSSVDGHASERAAAAILEAMNGHEGQGA